MMPSVSEQVQIDFDMWGVPTIQAHSRSDVSYAIGYLHGSERFFQMDLSRRSAAGELAALIGSAGINMDKKSVVYQFQMRAKATLAALPKLHRHQLQQYAKGVNDGLNSLSTRPFEYFLLRQKPKPWTAQDSLLLAYAFYRSMQDEDVLLDRTRYAIQQTLPTAVAAFFTQNGNHWEAALDGSHTPILSIPPAASWAYLDDSFETSHWNGEINDNRVGSNNWAVAPVHSETGTAMLANDPHLSVQVPGTWYKVSYNYPHPTTGEQVEVHGFSLPGLPVAVIGQSPWTAWGLTVAYIDIADLILLKPDPNNSDAFLGEKGSEPLKTKTVYIEVSGAEPVETVIETTRWGPVVDTLPNGTRLALKWAALHPQALNMEVLELEQAQSLDSLLEAANRSKLSVMNFVAADTQGNIGWTYFGFIPEQKSANSIPVEPTLPDTIWTKARSADSFPKIVNPPGGRLWTANNRVLDREAMQSVGIGSVENGARAYQIRQRLSCKDELSMQDMLELQHDHEVLLLKRWQQLIIDHIEAHPSTGLLRLEKEVRAWQGFASKDSKSYTIIRTFRKLLVRRISHRVFAPCYLFDEKFNPTLLQYEEPMYLLASQKPDFLAGAEYESFSQEISGILEKISNHHETQEWDKWQWGNHNQLNIKHPLSYAAPFLGRWLDMPLTQSDGDSYCPKVINGNHVASFRMVSIPGEPARSRYQMACGQSGHPLSPHYKDLHQLWLGKQYLPMLPGHPVSTLVITPQKQNLVQLK